MAISKHIVEHAMLGKDTASLDTRYVNITGDQIKPTTNSTATFGVQQADGTQVFNVDTSNGQVGLDLEGAGFVKTNASGVLSGGNSVDISADTNLGVTSPITLTGDDIGFDFSTNNIWTGTFKHQNSSNSTTALQVNKADTTNVFNVDTSNGRVGIGTDSPQSTLHVKAGTAPQFLLEASAVFTTSFRFKSAGNRSWDFLVNSTGLNFVDVDGGVTPLFLKEGGRVGITNTSPLAKFHLKGSSDEIQQIIQANSTQTANLVEYQDSNGNIHHAISLPGATDPNTYFNKQVGDSDTIIAGDTEPNLLRVDAGTDTVRMGDWDTNYVEVDKAGDVVFVGGAGLAFGEIYAYDTNTTITISGTGIANKVQITAFASNGQSNNTTPDNTTDDITITKAGKYLCTVSIHAESTGGSAYQAGFGVYKNNGATLFTNCHAHRNLSGGGGDTGSISISGILDLAVDDTVEVWVWNETNTNDIIIDDIDISIIQCGG